MLVMGSEGLGLNDDCTGDFGSLGRLSLRRMLAAPGGMVGEGGVTIHPAARLSIFPFELENFHLQSALLGLTVVLKSFHSSPILGPAEKCYPQPCCQLHSSFALALTFFFCDSLLPSRLLLHPA